MWGRFLWIESGGTIQPIPERLRIYLLFDFGC